jgi:hypothetical protein
MNKSTDHWGRNDPLPKKEYAERGALGLRDKGPAGDELDQPNGGPPPEPDEVGGEEAGPAAPRVARATCECMMSSTTTTTKVSSSNSAIARGSPERKVSAQMKESPITPGRARRR